MQTLNIFSDGGSRGNPGPAAIGAVIINETQTLKEISECIGVATNNQAEYSAIVAALTWVKENIKDVVGIQCFLDSQLVVEQLKGNYKMKNEGLKPLFWSVRGLIMDLGGKVSFTHVLREKNKEADRLVNLALDDQAKGDK
jgi:ribonuclease HI